MNSNILFKSFILASLLVKNSFSAIGQEVKAPIMGWSSWNSFRIHIDEKLIREQADAMVATGLHDAGDRYINEVQFVYEI